MARGKAKNENKGRNEGINNCCFAGVISKWFTGKDNRPDLISLQVPYHDNEYTTRVPITVWMDGDIKKYIEEKDIDEGDTVAVEAECTCPKATDYKPQFTLKTVELVRSRKE